MSIIIKTPEQIDGIRRSCRLAVDALNFAEQFVVAGTSTEQINTKVEEFIRDKGGVPAPLGYHGYPKSVCTSINEVICHGIPKPEDVLKEGDIIKIDVSTILDGYFGDTCKTFAVGSISDSASRILNAARESLNKGVEQVRPGNEFGMIGWAISKYAKEQKFSVVYQFAGHGVGLKLHEPPQVEHDNRKFNPQKMKPGMIFTIEPMICEGVPDAVVLNDGWTAITADKRLSAQFEHTLLVTDSGVEILTV